MRCNSTGRLCVSAKLQAAVRLHRLRAYQIAHRCHLHPSTLSKLLNGIERPRLGDERVLRLAAFLRIPMHEAFEIGHDDPEPKDDVTTAT